MASEMTEYKAGSGYVARVVVHKGVKQIELRRKLPSNTTNVLVIVALNGWHKGAYETRRPTAQWSHHTEDFQVRLSLNGPGFLTMNDWDQMHAEVRLAYRWLLEDAGMGHLYV